ncbi:hypothetical protein RUND412_000903 [Rhizina undulata]
MKTEEAPLGRKLWEHPDPESTEMYRFKKYIEDKYGLNFGEEWEENSLWKWSVENIKEFWGEVWEWTGVVAGKGWDQVVDENAPMFPRPEWFRGARLNFAENLLYPKVGVDEESIAVISATEEGRESVSWKELREKVRVCTAALKEHVHVGDRVVGYVGNHTNALVAMLATTSLGGIWSGISPDHGSTAVLDRWPQLEPSVLFADNAVLYNEKKHDVIAKLSEIAAELESLRTVVVFRSFEHPTDLSAVNLKNGSVFFYEEFLETAIDKERKLEFLMLEPDHPVYILFSSGTTGKPKCICHGAIGTLIQHKKEHYIQSDIKPGSVFFQFTTVTWMMWHWLVSGLASGATIVLYDGSPFKPSSAGMLAMPKLIDELGVTHFGTSAKYLSMLEQNHVRPKEHYDLSKLRYIFSTAAVLAPSTFEYVYNEFGANINLASITGGTDIISLFGAPSPLVPVHSGEIQCIGLGMKVEAWDIYGKSVEGTDEAGDLVCTKAFPCMPVTFWGKEGEAAYKKSYFETFPGVWHHGDFVKINPVTRGLVMLGRSDGILKPSGVRFGSAEIYNILLAHFPTEFDDALCIGRRRLSDKDEQVILFVKMAEGRSLTPELKNKVKSIIRAELSARHVPAIVDETPEIPVTTNGKKVEVAVKQILCGLNVKISASVANAGCLDWYRNWSERN